MPDLRFRLESALIELVMGLPPRVQRSLSSKTVVIDGLTLAPEHPLLLGL